MKFNFLSAQANNPAKNIYDFVVEDINGENFYFNKLKGKKILTGQDIQNATDQFEVLNTDHYITEINSNTMNPFFHTT